MRNDEKKYHIYAVFYVEIMLFYFFSLKKTITSKKKNNFTSKKFSSVCPSRIQSRGLAQSSLYQSRV